MIMVIFAHVLLYSFGGEDPHSFNILIVQFRMPLFFFVSGFLLWKPTALWDASNSLAFLSKKFKVQVLATLIFLAIYVYFFGYGWHDVMFSCTKYGYWFTLELFQYFILYVSVHYLMDRYGKYAADVLLVLIALAAFAISIKPWSFISTGLYNVMGMTFLRYFIYFYFGSIVKRNFDSFQKMLDNSRNMTLMLIAFFVAFVLYIDWYIFPFSLVIDVCMAIFGIIIVFSFFRKYKESFTKETRLGRTLQYVGTRTLDIYFLHYFFLPRNLSIVGEFFQQNSNPVLEFAVCLCVSAMVIAICLLVSNIIRLSPYLAHVLFGVKR